MEELHMEICPICGITRGFREFQQKLAGETLSKNRARWEQYHEPDEPPPGLPLTHEDCVHFALAFYANDSSMDATVVALNRAARKAGVDYNSVVRALNPKKTNEKIAGLPLTEEDRVRYALVLLKRNDSSEKPGDAAIALAAREVRVDPELVVKALHHANGA